MQDHVALLVHPLSQVRCQEGAGHAERVVVPQHRRAPGGDPPVLDLGRVESHRRQGRDDQDHQDLGQREATLPGGGHGVRKMVTESTTQPPAGDPYRVSREICRNRAESATVHVAIPGPRDR